MLQHCRKDEEMVQRHKKESFKGIGIVEIRPFQLKNGKKVYDFNNFTKQNLIVMQGRATLMDLMLGLTSKKLTWIRWGKGGAPTFPNGDPLEPYEVQDTDTNVYEHVLDKRLNPPNRLMPTVCSFTETIICDEVDDDINEAAILFEDPDTLEKSIFARITFPTARLTIEKGTGIELEWTYNFNSAKEQI